MIDWETACLMIKDKDGGLIWKKEFLKKIGMLAVIWIT